MADANGTNPAAGHLREHQIRPEWTEAEGQRRFDADVARLLTRRHEFVDVPCPACGSGERSRRMGKYTVDYQSCHGCGTMYVSPRPTPEILDDFYAHSENYAYWNDVLFPASEGARRELIVRPRVDRVLALCDRHQVRRDTLLEIGAGFGTFCEELTSRGAFGHVIAVEPESGLAASCRARGLDVRQTTVERLELPSPVDVIASFEVIEHIFDPNEFVRVCARLLVPGGLLMLTCPNIRGFDIDVLGEGSPAIDPEHLNYFHPRSLALLLERHGFSVLEAQTPGRLDADIVRNRVLSGEATLDNGFLRRVLIDEWERYGEAFQDFLVAQGLSSNMWIVARRALPV